MKPRSKPLSTTGDVVGWREFVIQAFQSEIVRDRRPAGKPVGRTRFRVQTNIRTSSGRCTCAGELALFAELREGLIPTNRFCRLPDVSMFGLAASTVLRGGCGLSAIHGDVRPLEEALEIMLQV